MYTEEDMPAEHQYKMRSILYPFDKQQLISGEEETEQCFLDASPSSKDLGSNMRNALSIENESEKSMKSLEVQEQEEI